MQAPLRSRLHFHTGQASPKADRASRVGWSELDNSHLVVRLNINVSMKSKLFNVKSFRAVNIGDRYLYQLKFQLHFSCCSLSFHHQVLLSCAEMLEEWKPWRVVLSSFSHLISSSFARKQVSASRASAFFHHAEPEMGCSRCLKRSEVFSNLCDDILRGICLVKNSIHPRMRKNFSNRALFPTTSARPV